MGKSHFSGIEVGDPGVGIWSSAQLAQKVKLTALNTGVQLHFPDGGIITELRVVDGAGALVVATLRIGTTLHGNEVFGAASTAGAPLAVNKAAPAGLLWIEATAGTPPLTVYVSYIGG